MLCSLGLAGTAIPYLPLVFLLLALPGITIAFVQQRWLRDAWAAHRILRWTHSCWRPVSLWVPIAIAAGISLLIVWIGLSLATIFVTDGRDISPALMPAALLLSVLLCMSILYPFHIFGQMARQDL